METRLRPLLLLVALVATAWGTIAGVAMAEDAIEPPATEVAPAATTTEAPAVALVEEEALDDGESVSEAEFNRRLLTTEEHVNSLKEEVFRSKATLQLLKEIVIQGSSTGARAVLFHVNELGPSFSIESMNYFLDGQSIYAQSVEEGGSISNEFKLHDGPIPPGNHNIAVSMVLRGNGFGVFSYVDQYSFNVQSSYGFSAEDGKSCEVWIRLKERKGIGRSFVERPWVEYDLRCTRVGQAD